MKIFLITYSTDYQWELAGGLLIIRAKNEEAKKLIPQKVKNASNDSYSINELKLTNPAKIVFEMQPVIQ